MGHNTLCDPSTLSYIEAEISSASIFMVSKVACKACKRAKKLLNELVAETGSTPHVFEVDMLGRKAKKELIKYLSSKTGIKTVPQIWINGRFVGGNDDIQQAHREGRLVPLIRMNSRRRQSGAGSSFSNRSPSPTVTFSGRSATTPTYHFKKSSRFNINSRIFGRQRSRSDVPQAHHRETRSYLGNAYGEQKWDKWDTSILNTGASRRSTSVQPRMQLNGNPVLRYDEWSLQTSAQHYGVPQVNRWISSSSPITNDSFVRFPNDTGGKNGWITDSSGGIDGWI